MGWAHRCRYSHLLSDTMNAFHGQTIPAEHISWGCVFPCNTQQSSMVVFEPHKTIHGSTSHPKCKQHFSILLVGNIRKVNENTIQVELEGWGRPGGGRASCICTTNAALLSHMLAVTQPCGGQQRRGGRPLQPRSLQEIPSAVQTDNCEGRWISKLTVSSLSFGICFWSLHLYKLVRHVRSGGGITEITQNRKGWCVCVCVLTILSWQLMQCCAPAC